MLQILLVAIYISFSVSGIVLIKAGGGNTQLGLEHGVLLMKLDVMTFLGLACYVISFLLFLKVVSLYELNYIVPITTGIVQILILLAAIFIFHERVTAINIAGVLVVICGLILMNFRGKVPTP